MRRHLIVLAALAPLALSACGKSNDTASQSATTDTAATTAEAPAAVADAGGPPTSWGKCAACHSNKPGVNTLGPSLAGVVGRKAGAVAGFAYSDANKNSGLTWDEATLDEYLTAPMKKIPGTKMVFAGIADAAERKELIGYLKTLK